MKSIFTRTEAGITSQIAKLYWREFTKHRRQALYFSSLITLSHLLRFVAGPLIMSYFIQSIVLHPSDVQTPLLLLGSFAITAIISTYANNKGYTSLFRHEEVVQSIFLKRCLDILMNQSYSFFTNQKVGTLSSDAIAFSRSYMQVVDTYFLQTNHLIITFFASLVVVVAISPILAVPLVIITILMITSNIHNLHARAKFRDERKKRTSALAGSLADILGNQILTRIFAREDYENQHVAQERRAIEHVAYKEIAVIERESRSRQIMLYSFQILTLLIALWLVHHGSVSIAALIFTVTYLLRTTDAIFSISGIVRHFEQAFLDATPMTKIIHTKNSIVDVPHAQSLIVTKGSVIFDSVQFAYNHNDSDPVFSKLSLTIKPGERIGLVGHSGGGKTTLTKLLLRFVDAQSGSITIDGQDISLVTQKSLREQIAYVPQEPFLFHRSLRDNIAYGRLNATDKEIIDAAKQTYAWEFIAKLPGGLDTIVGERGVKLSGGQRQRIAIARAVLKDAPILILDEATSALDSESETYIQKALTELMNDRTSIVIAHRLSTIAKLDRIIVLDNGKIVEDGTHDELLARHGVYAKLWTHQSGGFIHETT